VPQIPRRQTQGHAQGHGGHSAAMHR
jgi:hypothetical protein